MALDLGSALNVQSQYLTDLSYIAITGSVANNIGGLQNKLNGLASAYNSANITAQNSLDHQNDMVKIVNNENDRLAAKKQQIDSSLQNTQRMVAFNDSYRKKQMVYIYILTIMVLAILFYIVLVHLQRFFPVIPDSVITLLLIIIFSVAFVNIVLTIRSMSIRDELDFDRLKLPPPSGANPLGSGVNSQNNSDLFGMLNYGNMCVGQTCCSRGSVWNSGTMKCAYDCSGNAGGPYDYKGNCVAKSVCSAGNAKVCGSSCIDSSATCFESFVNLGAASTISGKIVLPNGPNEGNLYGFYQK